MEEKIEFNPCDLGSMLKLMDKYGDSADMMLGEDESGDFITVSICRDLIIVETYQERDWIKRSTYHRDGTVKHTFRTGQLD